MASSSTDPRRSVSGPDDAARAAERRRAQAPGAPSVHLHDTLAADYDREALRAAVRQAIQANTTPDAVAYAHVHVGPPINPRNR